MFLLAYRALLPLLKKLKSCQNVTSILIIFISLDVVSLYPSVPIPLALKVVSDFALEHWHKIDNLYILVEQFPWHLTLVSFNYEIQYNNKTYLQIKGCPMAHYAPPFSIISKNYIEKQALTRLKGEYDCMTYQSFMYKRYIDNAILRPFKKDSVLFYCILKVFNSIDENKSSLL